MFYIPDPTDPTLSYTAVFKGGLVTRFTQTKRLEDVEAITCNIIGQRVLADGTKPRFAVGEGTVYCSPDDAFDWREGAKRALELAVRDSFPRGNPLRATFHEWLFAALQAEQPEAEPEVVSRSPARV